jgi:hypothetical protein
MAEKQYKYKTTIKQPQKVADIKLDPKGGTLSERQYKAVKKDVYGASLLEKRLLVVEEIPDTGTDTPEEAQFPGEDIPDFEPQGKGRPDHPEDHAGWSPE